MRRPLLALLTAALIGTGANGIGGSAIALAAEAEAPPEVHWSFQGIFGTYDRAALARGPRIPSSRPLRTRMQPVPPITVPCRPISP